MRYVTFALLFFALPAAAQDQLSDQIMHLETGVVCAPDVVGTRTAPDTVAGVTNIIETDPPFVTTENRVPAVLGVGFGAKAQAANPFGLNNVTITMRHPPMGPEGATTQTFTSVIEGTDTSLIFYQFDYSYELLPGVWTIEARQDGDLLYRSQFQVLPPYALPELAGVCGFEELLS